ncbi:MAG: hypothetical protein LCH62_20575 [Proteobacteria bacterium]|nr:hypothetical protein [Pseudomonadota bacterium]
MKRSTVTAALLFASMLIPMPGYAEPLNPVAVEHLDRAIADRRIAGAVVLVAKDGGACEPLEACAQSRSLCKLRL